MVGVPGRSRACVACKSRRIACDLQQPECKRCIKAKRTCEYRQGHIFVLNDTGTHKTKYRKSCATLKSEPDASQTTTVSLSKEKCMDLVKSRSDEAFSECVLRPFTYYNAPSPSKMLQQALLASGIAFGETAETTMFFGLVSSSLVHCASTSLYTPALACYALWRGRLDDNSIMIDVSRQLYIHGLVHMQKALSNPQSARDVTTLAACHALGLYEALECPDNSFNPYLSHRAGCCRLVELRGPGAHIDGIAHELFINIRIFVVLEAIECGQRSFIGDKDWMTIPWEKHPRTSFDKIIDICTACPDIVHQARRLPRSPPEKLLYNALNIASDIAALVARLDAFYNEYAESFPGHDLYWEENTKFGYIIDDGETTSSPLSFETNLNFPDLEVASFHFIYWAFGSSLWSGLADLFSLVSSLGASDNFHATIRKHLGQDVLLSPDIMQSKWVGMVRKVCGSVAYCTTTEALASGPPRMGTALNMLIETMRKKPACKSELEWALKARQEIGRRWIRIMNCMT